MRISDWSADVCSSDLLDVISGELLARAGGGLGLTAIATPLAGMLAFVDVGDAKAAACGPVLTGAKAAAQRTDKGKPRDDVGQGTTAKSESGKASRSEEHTSELQSLMRISYAVFCLKKKTKKHDQNTITAPAVNTQK